MLFGVILAWVSFFNPSLFARLVKSKWMLLACIVPASLFALLIPKSSPLMLSIGFTILYLGAAAFILLVSGSVETVKEWLPFKAVAWIGLYSYTIYLWHLSVRDPIQRVFSRGRLGIIGWWMVPIVESIAAIVIAVIASRAVEWPVLRLRERLMPEKEIQAVAVDVVR